MLRVTGVWTILAATEYNRVHGVVDQSGPVHYIFQRAKVMAAPNNREYILDYVGALLFTYQGATNLETLPDAREKMSLKTRGILDKPMAPMLVIGGVLDTQVPIADSDLILHSGQTPQEAWINPQGGHMGRGSKWSDARIFKTITVPWILRMLDVKAQ